MLLKVEGKLATSSNGILSIHKRMFYKLLTDFYSALESIQVVTQQKQQPLSYG